MKLTECDYGASGPQITSESYSGLQLYIYYLLISADLNVMSCI
jgi:hypothetical protein